MMFVVSICLTSCHQLILRQALLPSPADWRFYGGSIGRTNASTDEIRPPLTVAWDNDGGAGFSVYSAAAVSNLLFIGNLKGEVHVMDINTGKEAGMHDFGSAVIGTPAVDREIMYVALGHKEISLIAYDLSDGSIPWKEKLGDIETSPLLVGDRIYVATVNGKLVCLNKETGFTAWEYEIPSRGTSRSAQNSPGMIHSSPASDGNLVVFGCDDGCVYAVSVDNGQLKWRAKALRSIVASPSISGNAVFVGSLDSTFYAFDIASGNIIWKQKLDSKIYASQSVGEKDVYVGTSEGILYSLSRETGNIEWTFKATSVISAPPLLSGNILYVGCLDKTLYAVDATTGELKWKFDAGGRIKTMPIAYKGYLVLLEDDRTVVALKQSRDRRE